MTDNTILVRQLGHSEYTPTWQAMKDFTDQRNENTLDEIWLVEHPPVFTLGLNSKPEHILDAGDIPVVKIDRGGQVTYHGPGQLIAYLLVDLKRRKLGIRSMVEKIEQAIINLLAEYSIDAVGRRDAPGVYVGDRKIAALGLRVRRSCSYHGLALNVDMDISPFTRINPCGHKGLEVTQISAIGGPKDIDSIATGLCRQLVKALGYNDFEFIVE
jgi:lipoyl(octanoyl) transferase